MRLEPLTLTGRLVRLEPLTHDLAEPLVTAAHVDRSSYGFTLVPRDVPAMHSYIDAILADAARDAAMPFAQRRLADGALVGCTRFMNVLWWPHRDTPAEVEIGGTWLAADAQRTPLNSEAKLLLLTQAFDVWRVHRVAICTDARNEASRRAIERLGAHLDGVLRHHRASMGDATERGTPRDSAMYSIIPEEWPRIGARLRGWLDAH